MAHALRGLRARRRRLPCPPCFLEEEGWGSHESTGDQVPFRGGVLFELLWSGPGGPSAVVGVEGAVGVPAMSDDADGEDIPAIFQQVRHLHLEGGPGEGFPGGAVDGDRQADASPFHQGEEAGAFVGQIQVDCMGVCQVSCVMWESLLAPVSQGEGVDGGGEDIVNHAEISQEIGEFQSWESEVVSAAEGEGIFADAEGFLWEGDFSQGEIAPPSGVLSLDALSIEGDFVEVGSFQSKEARSLGECGAPEMVFQEEVGGMFLHSLFGVEPGLDHGPSPGASLEDFGADAVIQGEDISVAQGGAVCGAIGVVQDEDIVVIGFHPPSFLWQGEGFALEGGGSGAVCGVQVLFGQEEEVGFHGEEAGLEDGLSVFMA